MQLQLITKEAIKVLHHLHKHQDEKHTKQSITEAVGISSSRFTRIMLKLRSKGLISSSGTRQSNSYMLGRPISEISFYDVVLAIEGENYNTYYAKQEHCKIHDFLQGMRSNMTEIMQRKSIVDLV